MHPTIFQIQIIAFILCFSSALARRPHGFFSKQNHNAIAHRNVFAEGDPAELTKRDDTKYVFMHLIVGNTFSYTSADWTSDIQNLQATGVDALALNIGSDDWEATQVANAYAAAQSLGTGFKLFLSFDFTAMGCVLSDLVSRVNEYAGHSSQFKVNGKPMISSYSGECLGNSGWASLKAQTNGYTMPFIPGLEGDFGQWPALDSWMCWGCAWPQGDYTKNTDDDQYYMNQLGTRYVPTISSGFYAHFSYKNEYLRGDEWLPNIRWEQLIAMRNSLTFIEMVTWNDFGESDYYGPIKGAQPAGTTWATNFPHTAFFEMSQYYITAFKTGSYPAITNDIVFFWARPHPFAATASGDPLPRPTGYNWAEDSMWAAVFATSDATVVLQCGSSSSTFSVTPGVNKLKIPLAVGQMTVKMIRNGQTIIDETPQDYTYVANPVLYNYNFWAGSAAASGGINNPTPTSSSSSQSGSTPKPTSSPPGSPPGSSSSHSTLTSSTTTSASTPTTTSGNVSWNYEGCYQDHSARILSQGPFTNSAQTVEKCLATCLAQKFLYAGVEFGVQCFCSNSIGSGAVKAAETDCSMSCAGNKGEKCGGGWRINVYQALQPTPSSTCRKRSSTAVQ